MKIILLQDVKKLGKKGEVKEVSDGYARNFLFQRSLAKPADAEALRSLDKEKKQEDELRRDEVSRYQGLAARLDKKIISVTAKIGERGKAFGAVTPAKIHEMLLQEKIDIPKEWIVMSEPIKTTGEHSIRIKFPRGIEGLLRITVMPENKK